MKIYIFNSIRSAGSLRESVENVDLCTVYIEKWIVVMGPGQFFCVLGWVELCQPFMVLVWKIPP